MEKPLDPEDAKAVEDFKEFLRTRKVYKKMKTSEGKEAVREILIQKLKEMFDYA